MDFWEFMRAVHHTIRDLLPLLVSGELITVRHPVHRTDMVGTVEAIILRPDPENRAHLIPTVELKDARANSVTITKAEYIKEKGEQKQ